MNQATERLAAELGIPREEIEAMRLSPDLDGDAEARLARKLTDPQAYDGAYAELASLTQNGHTVLKAMLAAACLARTLYRKREIPDAIFLDTMKCFPRFVNEHKASFGAYGFDRGFWVGRQLSLLLFRIGTLEYELVDWKGKPAVSVHIPSDADLSAERLDDSVRAAQAFLKQRLPAYAGAPMICDSWLLSPALQTLLPPSSKILGFQSRFRPISWDERDEGYRLWVFKRADLAPENFPEDTSLQRSIKRHVLNGGTIGVGFGEYIG